MNPSLNGADDNHLLELAQDGDNHALSIIITRYTPFAKYKAQRYFLKGAERQDLEQEAVIGLWKAVKNYDKNRNSCFKRFADLCIRNHIQSVVTKSNCQAHLLLNSSISLNQEIGGKGQQKIENQIKSESLDPLDIVIGEEGFQRITNDINKKLSPFETEVLKLFLKGCRYKVIAQELAIAEKSIYNAMTRIRRKLKKILSTYKDR